MLPTNSFSSNPDDSNSLDLLVPRFLGNKELTQQEYNNGKDIDSLSSTLLESLWVSTKTAAALSLSQAIAILIIVGPRVNEPNLTSTQKLAVIHLVSMSKNVLLIFGVSPLYATTIIGSVLHGEIQNATSPVKKKESKKAFAKLLRTAIIFGTSMGLLTVIFDIYSSIIFERIFQIEHKVAQYSGNYLRIYSFGAFITNMIRVNSEQCLLALKRNGLAAIIGIQALITGASVSSLLVFKTSLGFDALAIGFNVEALSAALGMTIALAKLRKGIPFFSFFYRSYEGIFNDLWVLLKTGFSTTVQLTSDMIAAYIIGTVLPNQLKGSKGLAVQSFASILAMLAVIPQFGSALAILTKVGNLKGNRHYIDASRYARIGLFTSMLATTVILTPFMIAPALLIKAINDDIEEDIKAEAKGIIRIACAGMVALTGVFGIVTISRTVNDSWAPTIIAALNNLVLGVGTAALLSYTGNLGLLGVNIGYSAMFGITFFALLPRYWQKTSPENIRVAHEIREDEEPQTDYTETSSDGTVDSQYVSNSCFSRIRSCWARFFSKPNLTEYDTLNQESINILEY